MRIGNRYQTSCLNGGTELVLSVTRTRPTKSPPFRRAWKADLGDALLHEPASECGKASERAAEEWQG